MSITHRSLLSSSFILVAAGAMVLYALHEAEGLRELGNRRADYLLQVNAMVLSAENGFAVLDRHLSEAVRAADGERLPLLRDAVGAERREIHARLAIALKSAPDNTAASLISGMIEQFRDWEKSCEALLNLLSTEQTPQAAALLQTLPQNLGSADLQAYVATRVDQLAQGLEAGVQRMKWVLILAWLLPVVVGFTFLTLRKRADPLQDMLPLANLLNSGHIRQLASRASAGGEHSELRETLTACAVYLQAIINDSTRVISEGLAKGNLHVEPKEDYRGDFSAIKTTLETALATQWRLLEDIVLFSQGLMVGDLSAVPETEYKGEFRQIKDALSMSIANLQQVIEDIVQVSKDLAEGKHDAAPKAEYNGEFAQIKQAMLAASAKLAETSLQNAAQDWLKTGQTQLNRQIRGEQEIISLAEHVIQFLTPYLGAQVGAFYLYEEGEDFTGLRMIATHAYTRRKRLANTFEVGEGVVGQAALEGKPIIFVQAPEDYMLVQTGLGETSACTVLVAPFLYEEETLKGVVELASFTPFTDLHLEFLHHALPTIAITLQSAQSRAQLQVLLEQSRSQAETLQLQQQQLQENNEELQVQSEELRLANEELELRSTDLENQRQAISDQNRELEINRRALEQKAEELELASKYKSEFLANMSHELRTPLNSLLILAELLTNNKEGNLTEKQVDCAHTIYNAGADLLKLINDILDLSKVEAGRLEVQAEQVPMVKLITAIEQRFQPIADKKSLVFHINLAEGVPFQLHTDFQRLTQILTNLLSNAFKFTEKGKVHLDIRRPAAGELTGSPLNPTVTVAFSVTDTGVGIPEDKQKLIFEAFQQADGTTSRRFGGTGLGLSISRQLARLMGGRIHLTSKEGQGSCFTLYLAETLPVSAGNGKPAPVDALPAIPRPAGSQRADTTAPPVEKPLPASEAGTVPDPDMDTKAPAIPVKDDRNTLKAGEKSILIVEDDSSFSQCLMDVAQEKGFKCLLAPNGREGLQLAEQYRPGGIILDVGLPQLNGWAVMERLKANPDTRHIPVHFISGTDADQEARKMGAIGYAMKPVSMQEVGEALKRIEGFIDKQTRQLLVVADKQESYQAIVNIIDSDKISCTHADTPDKARQFLRNAEYDCIILDAAGTATSASELFDLLKEEEILTHIPTLVYAEAGLAEDTRHILEQYENFLLIKTVLSPERLLDEATLFLHQVETGLPESQQQMLHMIHDKEAILANKKILLVDDDMRNYFALATILEEKSMIPISATTGKEALVMLKEQPDISLVLMDIMMPEMDGYEATRQIRAQNCYRKLPIITLTAKTAKEDRAKCIDAGANDYLAKPVNADKLLSLMRVWLYQ